MSSVPRPSTPGLFAPISTPAPVAAAVASVAVAAPVAAPVAPPCRSVAGAAPRSALTTASWSKRGSERRSAWGSGTGPLPRQADPSLHRPSPLQTTSLVRPALDRSGGTRLAARLRGWPRRIPTRRSDLARGGSRRDPRRGLRWSAGRAGHRGRRCRSDLAREAAQTNRLHRRRQRRRRRRCRRRCSERATRSPAIHIANCVGRDNRSHGGHNCEQWGWLGRGVHGK